LGAKLDAVGNGQSATADMLVVTNGSRTYQQATIRSNGATESQTVLVDLTKQKGWVLLPDERVKDQGKLGYCYSATISGTSIGGGIPGNVMPIEGLKFKQETKGNYYIETQTYELPTEEGKLKMVIAYYYEGNSITPKYTEVKEYLNGEELVTMRMTFTRIEYKADAKYLDFETILKQYIDKTDQIPSTTQVQEPSIAGLTIG
jgi:hypothetical protein